LGTRPSIPTLNLAARGGDNIAQPVGAEHTIDKTVGLAIGKTDLNAVKRQRNLGLMGNMCMRLRNAGKGEASPSLFPRFAPNTHIYLPGMRRKVNISTLMVFRNQRRRRNTYTKLFQILLSSSSKRLLLR
jgi:hypothetical protein